MSPIERIMRTAPVIPVLVIDDARQARPLAEALVAGGLTVLEVTLRTPAALDVIREMKQVAGAIVGAGTVLNKRQLDEALDAGAEFIVSPGLTENLARSVIAAGMPYLPGVATTSAEPSIHLVASAPSTVAGRPAPQLQSTVRRSIMPARR